MSMLSVGKCKISSIKLVVILAIVLLILLILIQRIRIAIAVIKESSNSTSRYLNDLLNIDNIYFDGMVKQITHQNFN